MRNLAKIGCMIAALLVGLSQQVPAKTLDISQWSHMAPVQVVSSEKEGAVEFALTPEVIDLSRPSLKDLRLVRSRDEEIGYYLRESKGRSHKVILKPKLLNRSYLPGRQCSVMVDFGGNELKNRISVKTTGTNFLRKVRIESSNDQHSWQIIRDNGFLFRTHESGDRVYSKSTVNFPENNQRYLKVTVFAGSGDSGVIEIEDVEVWQDKRTDPDTAAVPVVSAKTEQRKNVTEISLDLGFRNMPLCALTLAFGDRNFFREVGVYGRNSLVQTIRTVVEDSPKLEKSVPVPWRRITTGTVYRFSAGNSVDESLDLKLNGARYRYLLIKIKNYDDPPLEFSAATVTRYSQNVWFAARGQGVYTLYFGNSKAERPKYDVGRYISRLRRENVSTATLGEAIANPAFKLVAPTVPWSERYAGIIWVALLAMLAVLVILIYRISKATPKPQGHRNT